MRVEIIFKNLDDIHTRIVEFLLFDDLFYLRQTNQHWNGLCQPHLRPMYEKLWRKFDPLTPFLVYNYEELYSMSFGRKTALNNIKEENVISSHYDGGRF